MPLNHLVLFFLAAALLGLYIIGSEVVERSPRWGRLGRNRFSYALALGVYATTWTLFGSVGFAASEGYDFLAIYFGVTLSCIAIPFLWAPVAELVDRYRLGSVAAQGWFSGPGCLMIALSFFYISYFLVSTTSSSPFSSSFPYSLIT